MTDFFNKVWTSSDAELSVHLYMPHNGGFRKAVLEKDKIYYLTPKSKETCVMVMTGGEEVFVDLPLEKVQEMLKFPDLSADKIDFMPYTGPEIVRKNISSVFNLVTSAELRGPANDAFNLEVLGSDGSQVVISSADIEYVQESMHDMKNETFVKNKANGGGFYCKMPVGVMRQFLTHAAKSGAASLDLTAITNPQSLYQKEGLMNDIKREYEDDGSLFAYVPHPDLRP